MTEKLKSSTWWSSTSRRATEFAQRIYKEGEVEVDEQGANIIRNYVDPAPILAVVKTAIYNELDKAIINSQNQ